MKYVIHPLEIDRCISYIYKRLKDGKTFTQNVCEGRVFQNIKVHTYVPDRFLDVYNFDCSHEYDWVKAQGYYRAFVLEHLNSQEKPLIIMENSLAYKDDLYVREMSSKTLTIQNDVYVVLTKDDANAHTVDIAIKESTNVWSNIAVITSLPDGFTLMNNDSSDRIIDIVQELNEHLIAIVIDTYDQCSRLFIEVDNNLR